MKRSEAIFYFKDLVRDIRNIFIIIKAICTKDEDLKYYDKIVQKNIKNNLNSIIGLLEKNVIVTKDIVSYIIDNNDTKIGNEFNEFILGDIDKIFSILLNTDNKYNTYKIDKETLDKLINIISEMYYISTSIRYCININSNSNKETYSIPKELNTEKAKKLFEASIKAGLMDEKLQFNGSKYLAVYFAGEAAKYLGLKKKKWEPFEKLWDYKYLAQTEYEVHARIGKYGKDTDIEKINNVFNESIVR